MSRAFAISVMCVMCNHQVNHSDGTQVGVRANKYKALAHKGKCFSRWSHLTMVQRAQKLGFGKDAEAMKEAAKQDVESGRYKTPVKRRRGSHEFLKFIAVRTRHPDHGWNVSMLFEETKKAFPDYFQASDKYPEMTLDRFQRFIPRAAMFHSTIPLSDAITCPSHQPLSLVEPPLPAPLPLIPPTTDADDELIAIAPSPPSAAWSAEAMDQYVNMICAGLKTLVLRGKQDTVLAAGALVLGEVK